MADEADLVRRAAAGDLEAFDELIVLKRDRVYRTAWQVVRNTEDARDVAQLVFVKLWRGVRRYRGGRKLEKWMDRITVNQGNGVRETQQAEVIVVQATHSVVSGKNVTGEG